MSTDMPLQGAPNRTPRAALWIILIVLIAGVVALSMYLYRQENESGTTNGSVNSVLNVNGSSSKNLNTADNSNSSANLNENSNRNASENVNSDGWKTYSDQADFFSIGYPGDWKVVQSTSNVIHLTPKTGNYALEGSPAYPITITVSKDETANSYLSQVASSDKTNVVVQGISATKVDGYGSEVYYVFSINDGTGYMTLSDNSQVLRDAGSISQAELQQLQSVFTDVLQTINIE